MLAVSAQEIIVRTANKTSGGKRILNPMTLEGLLEQGGAALGFAFKFIHAPVSFFFFGALIARCRIVTAAQYHCRRGAKREQSEAATRRRTVSSEGYNSCPLHGRG
jgi:hypothetical protein